METMVDAEAAIPADVLFSAGYRGEFGYSSRNRAKCPDPAYGARLVAAGGVYTIVFEDGAQRALDGYAAGCADALFANADADKQRIPLAVLIWWTADFPARWAQVKEYARGWHDTSKRPLGLYGDGEIIRAAKAAGYIRRGWRTCSGGFPGSGGLPHPDAAGFVAAALAAGYDVVQACAGEHGLVPVPGYSVDTDFLCSDTIDAWGQTPAVTPGGWLMALTDAEQQELLDKTRANNLMLQQQQKDTRMWVGHILGWVRAIGARAGVAQADAIANDPTHSGG